MLRSLGVAVEVPLLNRGPERAPLADFYPMAIRERVWNEWAREDCETFGYRRL
jgi:hypothetical protein